MPRLLRSHGSNCFGAKLQHNTSTSIRKNTMSTERPRLLLKPKTAERRPLPRCEHCGDVISSGTYGAIFASTQSPVEVIKGSLAKEGELGCPRDLRNEFRMALLVEHILKIFQSCPWYKSDRRPWHGKALLQTLHPHDWTFENGACFFSMSRVFPFNSSAGLIELTPGYPTDRFSKGVITGGERWEKLGATSTNDTLQRLFGIDLAAWGELLGRFAGLCHKLGIILNDVEFILGRLSQEHPPQIFLLDFDKCYMGRPQGCADIDIHSIERLTLHQFPTNEASFREAYRKTLCPPHGQVDECSPLKSITSETIAHIIQQIDVQMHCTRAGGCSPRASLNP